MVQRDGFLCAAMGTSISFAFNKKLGAGFFGGEGFILQRLSGNGLAFFHAGGTLIERKLEQEVLRVDTSCIVAFESTITYKLQACGRFKVNGFWWRRGFSGHSARNW